jgi:DNA-binding Lrp family transcriptional regulator
VFGASFRRKSQGACTLNPIDAKLQSEVQRRADSTAEELAVCLDLSPSQGARRRAWLEAERFIVGYRARLDLAKLGLSVQALI